MKRKKNFENQPSRIRNKHRSRFSDRDRQMLAIALRALKNQYGTWWRLAEAMKVAVGTLHQVTAGKSGSMGMVVRAATLAHIPVEVLLSGRIDAANRCPTCGQIAAEQDEGR